MKKNVLVLLFQTLRGTLNLIDYWVCHPPIRLLRSIHHLIVIPFNFTEKSTGNSKVCPSSCTFHAKHLPLPPHVYPHVFHSLHSDIPWGRLLVAWPTGTMCTDCLRSVLWKTRTRFKLKFKLNLGTLRLPCGWEAVLDHRLTVFPRLI